MRVIEDDVAGRLPDLDVLVVEGLAELLLMPIGVLTDQLTQHVGAAWFADPLAFRFVGVVGHGGLLGRGCRRGVVVILVVVILLVLDGGLGRLLGRFGILVLVVLVVFFVLL